ncbi:putative sulfate/molybdate transporter [Methanospirillum lacunae]|uniref:Sulfate transporter n=1 Tax=Methanospirillum lacunae TaxID=668570 RepID=A0A2V2N7P3_9EURY|nr:putative sulfate/molybdate transporter [Methanospirillum lacunae]PWR74680.1 sulfate transporter [Methanospirillum lacunae]
MLTVQPEDGDFFRITLGNIAGSVGNFGTIIPLFFAVSLATGMSLSLMLLSCGIWYIITGFVYKIPISVEPLKAVAAVAIAGGVTTGEIAASGIITGTLFCLVGLSGKMQWLATRIPSSVVRGIQLALGLILLRSAIMEFGIHDLSFFIFCLVILALFLLGKRLVHLPDLSALVILCIGIIALLSTTGIPTAALPTLPIVSLPNYQEYVTATWVLVIPQIPLTLANSILATALLSTELFHRRITPDKLSFTIGAMSLSTSILGGFPMCHGAGGVAAHYRFGARSGCAMIIGGIILICGSVFLTNPETLTAIPGGVFGALLFAVALELIGHGLKTEEPLVSMVMAFIAIPAGIAVAFIAGLLFAELSSYFRR